MYLRKTLKLNVLIHKVHYFAAIFRRLRLLKMAAK